MAHTMTPSEKTITKGQAGKFVDVLVDALVKSALPSEPTQEVLETQGAVLADECVALVRRRVEALTGMTARRVKVNRARSNTEAIAATGRKQYVTKDVVDGMPAGEGEDVTLYYFKPDSSCYDRHGLISCAKVAEQYERHGLKPDPKAQAADNESDPAFADETPNTCQWQDADGNYCCAAFGRWDGGREVSVGRDGSDWSFAGVRK